MISSSSTRRLLFATKIIVVLLLFHSSQQNAQAAAAAATASQISIRMPDIRPDHAEQYLCIAHRLPVSEDGQFIVAFNPESDSSRVHHMLMYGCELPGIFQRDSPNFVWDCSEMLMADAPTDPMATINSFEQAPVCNQNFNHKLMYGWAMDAPALKLPNGVGFKVGGSETRINYLVLQVHYGHYQAFRKNPDLTDNSGLILNMKANDEESGITKQAGVLVLISLGQIMKGKSQHEIWCEIEDNIVIHPFRFRVHTHKLGTNVIGAKIVTKNNDDLISSTNDLTTTTEDGQNLLIGQGDPQKPQMFYPVKEKNITLKKGDMIYAKCEYNNNRTQIVNIGQTGMDEMCNFYVMYWTENSKLLSKDSCMSYNPRKFFNSIW